MTDCAYCGMPVDFLGPGEGCPARSNGRPCEPESDDDLDEEEDNSDGFGD